MILRDMILRDVVLRDMEPRDMVLRGFSSALSCPASSRPASSCPASSLPTSRFLQQPRQLGCVRKPLEAEHRVAQLLDLRLRQRLGRELLELGYDVGVGSEVLL